MRTNTNENLRTMKMYKENFKEAVRLKINYEISAAFTF